MFSFNIGGIGWDEDSWEVAFGVLRSNEFMGCLFGFAYDKKEGISVDLLWIPVV